MHQQYAVRLRSTGGLWTWSVVDVGADLELATGTAANEVDAKRQAFQARERLWEREESLALVG
jgi:hypothetical protein